MLEHTAVVPQPERSKVRHVALAAVCTMFMVPAANATDAIVDPDTYKIINQQELDHHTVKQEEQMVDGYSPAIKSMMLKLNSKKTKKWRPMLMMAGGRNQPICTTTRNSGGMSVAGRPSLRMFSVQLNSFWCRKNWKITQASPGQSTSAGGWLANAYHQFDYWDPIDRHFYPYGNHNPRSGYAIIVRAHFKVCIDPVKFICPVKKWIELRSFLHADGTYHLSQHYSS